MTTIKYVLPDFIIICDSKFVCHCKNCGTDGKTFTLELLESHFKTLNMPFFVCPVPDCCHNIPRQSKTITAHIIKSHPTITRGLKLAEGKSALFCLDCNSYTNKLHFHCRVCENNSVGPFKTKELLDEHLKTHEKEKKWFFEKPCKRGTKCSTFKTGQCGFNHLKHSEDFIFKDNTTEKVCRYEQPWIGKRCTKLECSFDHLWGRVAFVLKERGNTSTVYTVSSEAESAGFGGGYGNTQEDTKSVGFGGGCGNTQEDAKSVGFGGGCGNTKEDTESVGFGGGCGNTQEDDESDSHSVRSERSEGSIKDKHPDS